MMRRPLAPRCRSVREQGRRAEQGVMKVILLRAGPRVTPTLGGERREGPSSRAIHHKITTQKVGHRKARHGYEKLRSPALQKFEIKWRQLG